MPFILTYMKKILLLLTVIMTIIPSVAKKSDAVFLIAGGGKAAPIVISDNDWPGVRRAAADLADDVRKVTGIGADIHSYADASLPLKSGSVIVGTIGRSKLIDDLISRGKLDVDSVRGQWESYVTDVIDGNLVIAGSDKRGTIYGIYDLSSMMGVSPWYYWADVPVEHKDRVE